MSRYPWDYGNQEGRIGSRPEQVTPDVPLWEEESILSNIRFALQRLRGGSGRTCTYEDQIRVAAPNSEGCERCIAMGDTLVHLRTCATCGQVGCCDSSKNRHAHRHADEAGHPIARSKEPGVDWLWCYVDEALVRAEVS